MITSVGLAMGCGFIVSVDYDKIPTSTGGGATTTSSGGGAGGGGGVVGGAGGVGGVGGSGGEGGAPPSCTNNVKDGNETDVDCGGGSCPGCADGQPCLTYTDCAGRFCDTTGGGGGSGGGGSGGAGGWGICAPCAGDGDCQVTDYCNPGDDCVVKQANGLACGGAGVCLSGHCVDGYCCATACEGTCESCAETNSEGTCSHHAEGVDPESECAADVCSGSESACRCDDGLTNGGETALNCGGGICPGCAAGLTCTGPGDCISGVCTNNTCQPGFCGDGVTQGTEQCDDGNQSNNDDCPDDMGNGGACQHATCDDGFLHSVGTHTETDLDCGGSVCNACPDGLLLSEIVVQPTTDEFIEILNPTGAEASLSHVYLADYNTYYGITQAANPPISSDFRVRFPMGTTIVAGGRLVISTQSATDFFGTFGFYPDFDLDSNDAGAPAMEGEIGSTAGFTNASEMLVLFFWDGASARVKDVDYLCYGDTSASRADKTGVATYLPDTPVASQDPSASPDGNGESASRCDGSEGTETASGGNGYLGHDETSENLSTTWEVHAAPTPGAANTCS